MFKFIHAADLHLDSPLRGLEQYPGAPVDEIRTATRRAWENVVQTAIDEQVDFVLVSGDVYDGDWRDYNTGLYFTNQASRLRAADIPLFLIAGNHDAANRMTRSLRMPENVTFLSAEKPQTETLEDLGVAIHGQSFATAAIFDNLSAAYPSALPGLFNIGMLHTCAGGREGHDNYAPCSVEELKLKGYDYWALGHIHKRETLSEQPLIAFSGNIQGRHIRETGPKGCLLVTVEADRSLDVEFRPMDVLRWEHCRVDVSEAGSVDEILQQTAQDLAELRDQAEGRLLAVRVELTGQSPVHRELLAQKQRWMNEVRSLAIDVGGGDIWVEKTRIRTSEPASREGISPPPDTALGALASLFQQVREDVTKLSDVGFDVSDVAKKLPAELADTVSCDDPQWLLSVIEEAESRLLAQLGDGEEDR